jgi:hypothetical protein
MKKNNKYSISINNFVQGNFSTKMRNNTPSLQELTEILNCYEANNLEEYRIEKSKSGKYNIK